MIGQAGVGTYVMYGAVVVIIGALVLLFLRTAVLVSMLWLAPAVAVVRRLGRVRRGWRAPPPRG